METVTIFPDRRKLLILTLAALIFVVAGIFIIKDAALPFILRFIGGYCGIAFFGSCLAYGMMRLVKPVPSVVISNEGLFDNASATGAGMLRWSEIADVKIYSFMNQRFLGIIPHNPEEVVRRQRALKRCLIRLNRRLVQAPFNIPENALPVKLEEIFNQINGFRSATSNIG
jgi:hypothetical protein